MMRSLGWLTGFLILTTVIGCSTQPTVATNDIAEKASVAMDEARTQNVAKWAPMTWASANDHWVKAQRALVDNNSSIAKQAFEKVIVDAKLASLQVKLTRTQLQVLEARQNNDNGAANTEAVAISEGL